MPKVTDEHLAARREQVLQAAWACFSENGFHATTMADVIARSGLSAGAVYRYFTGKSDLVRATADRALGEIGPTLTAILEADEAMAPVDAVARVLTTIDEVLMAGPTDVSRVAMMAWAESLRSAEVREVTQGAMTSLRGSLRQVALRAREAGLLPPEADPATVSEVMLSLVVGWVVQRNIAGAAEHDTYVTAVRAMLRD
jgi:AcrR family transcriptional regulator